MTLMHFERGSAFQSSRVTEVSVDFIMLFKMHTISAKGRQEMQQISSLFHVSPD